MIDIVLYRFRVGVYHGNALGREQKQRRTGKAGSIFNLDFFNFNKRYFIQYHPAPSSAVYLCYIFCLMISIWILTNSLLMVSDTFSLQACPSCSYSCLGGGPSYAFIYNIVYVVYFIIHILNQYYIRTNSFDGIIRFCGDKIRNNILVGGRVGKYLSMCIVWTFMVNLILVTVVNPSILNPGPVSNNLSIYYQNVQGLIPFGQLKDSNPVLDATKIFEISSHLNRSNSNIDVVILNETWLKRSIHDNEIFPSAQYKVFRRDRSAWSHPPDPLNPNRFRRNGGGVLMAVRTDLEITSKEIKLGSGAEIIAVEFTIASGTKFIICNYMLQGWDPRYGKS